MSETALVVVHAISFAAVWLLALWCGYERIRRREAERSIACLLDVLNVQGELLDGAIEDAIGQYPPKANPDGHVVSNNPIEPHPEPSSDRVAAAIRYYDETEPPPDVQEWLRETAEAALCPAIKEIADLYSDSPEIKTPPDAVHHCQGGNLLHKGS